MTEERLRSVFTMAGIQVLRVWALVDGYGHSPYDPRFFETLPRQVWWLVKTPYGLIEIGWRKRVIHIDWSETPVRAIVTQDEVTKGETFVHAWSELKAIEYLKAWREVVPEEPS